MGGQVETYRDLPGVAVIADTDPRQDIHRSGSENKQVKDSKFLKKFMTRLGRQLKRLENVTARANEEPIRVQINYEDVRREIVGGYEVVVPRARAGRDRLSGGQIGESSAMMASFGDRRQW
jgi:hypothetical protein